LKGKKDIKIKINDNNFSNSKLIDFHSFFSSENDDE
jgi:hypothetical protein